MTNQGLRRLKLFATWSGVLVTLVGIVVSIIEGGSWLGNGLALFGVAVTCVGQLASDRLDRRQESEAVADKERIEELVYRLEDTEERLSDPDLQRVVHMEASRYAEEHQDDDR
jgi:hypothetical protein